MLSFLTQNFLILPGMLLQGCVLLLLIKKAIWKEFPVFLLYTFAHLVFDAAYIVAGSISPWAYFYTYWAIEGVDAILTLVVIQSVFLKIFDSYPALKSTGLIVCRWAIVAFCTFALLAAIFTSGSKDDQVTRAVFLMEECIQFVQVGMLLCLFLFSRLFGLTWRHQIYGIILGFGLCATLALIVSVLRTQLGPSYHYILKTMFPAAYVVGVLTWIYYLLSKKSVEISSKPPSSVQLQAWNEALAGILRK